MRIPSLCRGVALSWLAGIAGAAPVGPDYYIGLDGSFDARGTGGSPLPTLRGQAAGEPGFVDGMSGKALALGQAGQHVDFADVADRGKPLSVLVVARCEFDPAEANDNRYWLVNAGGEAAFFNRWSLMWTGSGLKLASAKAVRGESASGVTVEFKREELGKARGRWLFFAFSAQAGAGWGGVGDVEDGLVKLKPAKTMGTGELCGTGNFRFTLGCRPGGGLFDKNGFTIDQVAIYRRSLSPEEIVGAFNGLKDGRTLEQPILPADASAAILPPEPPPPVLAPSRHTMPTTRIETPKMVLEFSEGWLVRWTHKQTHETVEFGKTDLGRIDADNRHYVPGAWWPDWKLPHDLERTGTSVTTELAPVDETAAMLAQSSVREGGEVCSLQWSVRIPYDQVDTLRIPYALAPERMVGKGCLDDMTLRKPWQMKGRYGQDSVTARCFAIQGRTGGLLVYMDDPGFEHYMMEEYRKAPGELTLTVRSVAEPPWKPAYAGARWVIRQYTGGINEAAQLYQDYLQETHKIVPLADRPTAWAKDLALCFVGGPWESPLPFKGKSRPSFNYSSDWEGSLRTHGQWLDNVAKVVDPHKTMFYCAGWRYVPGVDASWPEHSIDPYFARMVHEVRRRGFHVMLHFNNVYMNHPSAFHSRYLKNQSQIQGLDYIQGVGFDALQNQSFHKENKDFIGKGPWAMGVDGLQSMDVMNPAFEGWRYMFVSAILSAVKATEADAVHLDVPNLWLDLHNERYGMSCQQGYRAFYKLLRETFDEQGLQHVAIATEGMPNEAALPYVDFAQMARGKSAAGFIMGSFNIPDMFGMEGGQAYDDIVKAREAQQMLLKSKRFDPVFHKRYLSGIRELGEPSFKTMIVSRFVRPYPHLGAVGPASGADRNDPNRMLHSRVLQAMVLWFDMSVDGCIQAASGYPSFLDAPPWESLDVVQVHRKRILEENGTREEGRLFNDIDYGRFALVRFWQANAPRQVDPRDFQEGDIVRWRLKDGRVLAVTRAAPTLLRWAFGDGTVLAELDLFEGWKNHGLLLRDYEPEFLKNQIDASAAAR